MCNKVRERKVPANNKFQKSTGIHEIGL
jgi:hypothetical protein